MIARTTPGALRVRLDDVVAVGGDAGAGEPGVDPGAAGARRARPAPARRCPRPRRARSRRGPCPTGGRPAPGSSLRVDMARIDGEAGDRQRVDDRLGAAGHHHVGPAGPDDVQAQRDRLGAGRAGAGHASARRPGRRSSSPTQAAGPLGISIGTVCGRDPPRPGRLQDVVLGEQGLRAADAGADADRRAAPGRAPESARPASAQACVRGDQRDRLGPVQPAQLDPVDHLGRVDGQLGGDPDRQLRGPLLGERPTPERPASMASQVDATSPPSGVVAPSPVTTTSACHAHRSGLRRRCR